MPLSGPGRLTRQQDADVLAFMLSTNKFPAGKTEISRQSEMLKEIRFDSEKPADKKQSRHSCSPCKGLRSDDEVVGADF